MLDWSESIGFEETTTGGRWDKRTVKLFLK